MSLRTINISAPPSARLLTAWAALGLAARRSVAARPLPLDAARELLARLPRPGVALVTGASGSGKTTLLRAVAESSPGAVWVDDVELPPGAVIDQFDGRICDAIASLSRAGLAEGALLGRSPAELSRGEAFRLRLALALHRAPEDALLLADEFASVLDPTTARCVSLGVARWAARTGRRVVCATAHDGVREWLKPECWCGPSSTARCS